MHCHSRYSFGKLAKIFKEGGALNHSERGCHLGKECCSKGKEKLIETLFYASDGTLTEATNNDVVLGAPQCVAAVAAVRDPPPLFWHLFNPRFYSLHIFGLLGGILD